MKGWNLRMSRSRHTCILPVDKRETTGEGKALACLKHSSYMNNSQCSNCIPQGVNKTVWDHDSPGLCRRAWKYKDAETEVNLTRSFCETFNSYVNTNIKAGRLKAFAFVPGNSLHPVRSFFKFQWEATASLTSGSFGMIDIICYH